jgi:hypothetical protein
MPDTVVRIRELAQQYGVSPETVLERARLEWNLPTVASWTQLQMNPYM